jgi:hypothetical protein
MSDFMPKPISFASKSVTVHNDMKYIEHSRMRAGRESEAFRGRMWFDWMIDNAAGQ